MQLLGFSDYESQARRLADSLGIPYAQVAVHKFPDGESLVTLPAELSDQLIVCRSLDHPNEKLVELLLVSDEARRRGVKQTILVAPYLGYMRQDKAFNRGEVVSQKVIGRFLADLFDAIITVDAHLHRIQHLSQAIPTRHAINVSATNEITAFLKTLGRRPLLVGPDEESQQWVRAIAEAADLDHVIANKQRFGDRTVQVDLPEYHYRGNTAMIIDDIGNTGRTMAAVAKRLKDAGVGRIDALVTHALFTDDALDEIDRAEDIKTIWSTDSITHPSNAIHLDSLLAKAIGNIV